MAEVSERVFRELVLKTLDAALDEDCWPELLRSLAAASGGIGSLYVGCAVEERGPGFIVCGGLDQHLSELFMAHFQDNPWSRAALGRTDPDAFVFNSLVDHRLVRSTEFYATILQPQDTETMVGLILPSWPGVDTGGVSVAFDGRDDDAPRTSIALLNRMAPYLRRAIRINLKLRQARRQASNLEAALHGLPCAVLLVAQAGRVLFANRRAAALLSAGDGLKLLRSELVASRSADTRALRRMIGCAGDAAKSALRNGADSLAVERPSGKPALSILVAPVSDLRAELSLDDSPAALLMVTDPQEGAHADAQSVQRLGALYGLTPMEARVAVHVALGLSGPEAAEQLGIGPGTVHGHLKSVFAKTGVRRQSSLARLLTRTGVLDLN